MKTNQKIVTHRFFSLEISLESIFRPFDDIPARETGLFLWQHYASFNAPFASIKQASRENVNDGREKEMNNFRICGFVTILGPFSLGVRSKDLGQYLSMICVTFGVLLPNLRS